ncbi:tyrosine-type recombinase/integrase [Ureibacillus sinduriensis]|uniref:Recombinase XerD n=1 Tax=Ureibacillus sinduriensis BLB-1 = JCM 15800 TaxID=1384057 RepID=A0A0A3I2R0_9BACL|nr:site-specific integrase [Ureibacillus sinduriensis]KGR76938.1 hypothetical protein CD33_04485 [Ureibacillus sinduriensis BLB-1 = JCM 15800]
MEELASHFKGYMESLGKSRHTIKQYGIDTEQFLRFMQDHHLSFDDHLHNIVGTYNSYLEEVYSSAASINRKRASLLQLLTFLEQRKIVSGIPVRLLKPTRLDSKPIQTLTIEQLKKVTNYWFEVYQTALNTENRWIALRNFCLVNMLLELGLKPSEITALKWSSIKGREVTIVQNKKSRKLLLSQIIYNWLELFRYETAELLPLSNKGEFVWLGLGNKQNAPITVKTVERIFQSMSQQLGFKITATVIRYTLIEHEVKNNQEVQLSELYKRYGYSRKSVLLERVSRFNY